MMIESRRIKGFLPPWPNRIEISDAASRFLYPCVQCRKDGARFLQASRAPAVEDKDIRSSHTL